MLLFSPPIQHGCCDVTCKAVILGFYVKSLHPRKLVDNTPGWGGRGGGEGGILKQYLGFGEPLCVRKPDPVLDKKFLKYKPGLGQHPKFYFPV